MISWNDEKNQVLIAERGVTFEMAVAEIEAGRVLAVVPNPTHQGQQIYVIRLAGYVCNVPFVMDEAGNIFLKTIYQTRKGQQFYGGEE